MYIIEIQKTKDMGSQLPLELVTLLFSSGFSGLLKLFAMGMQARRHERLFTLQALKGQRGLVDDARRYENKGFQWTRRIIALLAVFFVIVFPKLVSVLWPEVPILYGYSEASRSFFCFGSPLDRIHWMQLKGLVITPLDTHLLSAIVGLYFGGSIVVAR